MRIFSKLLLLVLLKTVLPRQVRRHPSPFNSDPWSLHHRATRNMNLQHANIFLRPNNMYPNFIHRNNFNNFGLRPPNRGQFVIPTQQFHKNIHFFKPNVFPLKPNNQQNMILIGQQGQNPMGLGAITNQYNHKGNLPDVFMQIPPSIPVNTIPDSRPPQSQGSSLNDPPPQWSCDHCQQGASVTTSPPRVTPHTPPTPTPAHGNKENDKNNNSGDDYDIDIRHDAA